MSETDLYIYWCGALSVMSWYVEKSRGQKFMYGILSFVKKMCMQRISPDGYTRN